MDLLKLLKKLLRGETPPPKRNRRPRKRSV